MPQKARMEDVFQGLHKFTNYPVDQMIATEIMKYHFQQIFDSTDSLDALRDEKDPIVV